MTTDQKSPGRIARLLHRPPIVPVVRLHGAIGVSGALGRGLDAAGVAPRLEAAFAVKQAPAVALAINSPGGSAAQSALIAKHVDHLKKTKGRRVIAFVEDVAASGGYWLATAADEILVDETSIVGSIGVVSAGFGFHDAIARLGVERRVHTAGDRKTLLDPFRPEREEDVARLKSVQRDIHAAFIARVRAARGARLRTDEDVFNGDFWIGARAVELGLADAVGDLRTTLAQRYGDRVRLRVMAEPRGLLRRLARAGAASAAAAGVDAGVDAVAVAVETRALRAQLGL